MRALFSIGIFLFASQVYAQLLVPDELVCKENMAMKRMLQARAMTPGYYGYDILYHRCEWQVNPNRGKYLRGKVLSMFRTTLSGDSIGFDLMANMQVDSVYWHGSKTIFNRNGNKLFVGKPGGWAAAQTDSVTIYYQGVPDYGSGFGYYNYDNHLTGPIVYTLSEPYGAAYWWPCKQTLNDKIDSLDIIMRIPPAMKAGCNGVLVRNDSLNDTTRIMVWKHRYPVATYLVSFAVSNYLDYTVTQTFSDRPQTMPVVNYVFPQSIADIQKEMPGHQQVLRMFDSLIGHYPFDKEKYGHSQFTWGGGMEHQTMSSVVNFGWDLLAHELAHQWFGDKVTCGTWADLWLNEGFATYMNALCYRYLRPPGEFSGRMAGIRNAATSQTDGSVFARDTVTINQLFSGNLRYNKGAFVLHMLRVKVGDAAFFGALKKYLTQPATAYGFAKTGDLKQIMENESGMNLDTFFLRWFWGEGYPVLQINWQQSGNLLSVRIRQSQSHFSVPFYELKIPLRFRNQNRDTMLYFMPEKSDVTYQAILPFSADSAEFDPDVTVLAKASVGGINLDLTKTGNFTILPNPVQSSIRIQPWFNVVKKVEIFDVTGQLVAQTPSNFKHSVGDIISLSAESLSPGTYVAKIHTQNHINSIKFVKE